MKKFLIVSASLILAAAIFFTCGLVSYIGTVTAEPTKAPTTAPTQAPTLEPMDKPADVAPMPKDWNDNGMFKDNYEKAYNYVVTMPTEQLVGQMLLASCPYDGTADTVLTKYAVGGVVYTADNFYAQSAEQVKTTIATHRNAVSTPVLTAVTEEGGAKTTLSDLDAFPEYNFSSPRKTFAEGGMDAIKEAEQQKAKMLSAVGINLNLSPVCDMAVEQNQIMYSRSLGGTVEETSEFARISTEAHKSANVSVALKHFPGYGTNLDTVEPVVVDTREASVFETTDFKPFEAGINAGAHSIMVSNVVVNSLDSNRICSLSPSVHTTLRDTMKYTGLIITDNLDKADYSSYSGGKDVYVQAVLAGNDLIMVSDIEKAYTAILNAVKDGTIKLEDLQKACTRIIAYKYIVGLMK